MTAREIADKRLQDARRAVADWSAAGPKPTPLHFLDRLDTFRRVMQALTRGAPILISQERYARHKASRLEARRR